MRTVGALRDDSGSQNDADGRGRRSGPFRTTWRFRATGRFETTWQFCTTWSPHNLSVDSAAEPLEQPPGQLAVSQVTDDDKEALRSACCAAPAAPLLVTAFLLYVRPPSTLTHFGYSALVPAVSSYPYRLDSTLNCIAISIFVEPYIIDCVALLYRVSSPFSFSVNYCILHIAWLILNSGDYSRRGERGS